MRLSFFVLMGFFLLLSHLLSAQQEGQRGKTVVDGHIVSYEIIGKDTLFMMDLKGLSVSSPRKFENREDYLLYLRYRRYAAQVYPYALEAMRIYLEQMEETQEMRKGKKKRHIKKVQKELEDSFEEPLKKLTKTQGMILIKMIERELEIPFHELLKELRGPFTAGYWGTLGRMNGYRLREGYSRGDNPILDIVLDDFNINPEQESSKYLNKK
jgi:hypothetical protein